MPLVLKQRSVLPGFGLTLGFTVLYLSLIVLIPLSSLFLKTATVEWAHTWRAISNPAVIHAFKLSFYASLAAALVNCFFGFGVAWMLVRYSFFGRRVIDAIVDLPFAMPTAVSGIALTAIYSPKGWVGQFLAPHGIKVAYTPLGVAVALTFIGLPFVVRTLQPALQDLDAEIEEAAASLGASRWQTFRRIIIPTVLPAILTGFSLAFARALGEYGSVVFISANLPMKTQIAPQLIFEKLDQFDYAGATAIASVMLIASFFMLLVINLCQWWASRRQRGLA
jgi:sulfate/thiosulfate transport system permease protein